VDPTTEALRRLLSGRVLLFCHHNADPDSVCAAYALKELAEALTPTVDADIVLTEGVSSLSKRIIEAVGIETVEEASVDEADALFVLDASTPSQLGKWGEAILSAGTPKALIDHHAPTPDTVKLADVYVIDEEASSTCEVVYGLYRRFGVEPSAGAARALLVGIAYDSRHFTLGTAGTFRAVSELLEIDGDVKKVLRLLASEMDRSERIARLKAAQRVRIHDVEGWTIATSRVNSFQASAARGLVSLGADAVAVAGGEKGVIKASLRSTNEFHRGTSIHLGRDLAMSLGYEFGGAGSGHPTAAGINARGNPQSMLQRAVELVSDMIRKRNAAKGVTP